MKDNNSTYKACFITFLGLYINNDRLDSFIKYSNWSACLTTVLHACLYIKSELLHDLYPLQKKADTVQLVFLAPSSDN